MQSLLASPGTIVRLDSSDGLLERSDVKPMATAFRPQPPYAHQAFRRPTPQGRGRRAPAGGRGYRDTEYRMAQLAAVSQHRRPNIQRLPERRPIPDWLRLLIRLQRGSVIVTFFLVTAALVVYGSTIYMQQLWSKEYRKLQTLQRSERQMIAAGSVLKNQIAQQAEQPGSGLVPQSPNSTILLKPAPERSGVQPRSEEKGMEPPTSTPLGY